MWRYCDAEIVTIEWVYTKFYKREAVIAGEKAFEIQEKFGWADYERHE